MSETATSSQEELEEVVDFMTKFISAGNSDYPLDMISFYGPPAYLHGLRRGRFGFQS